MDILDEGKKLRRISRLQPRYLIILSVFLFLLMIVSAYYELLENKKEVYHMLDESARSLINTIERSSVNTIISDQELEGLLTQHLFAVARNVKRLDSLGYLTNNLLEHISQESGVYRINVFNKSGEKVFTNLITDTIHTLADRHSPLDYLKPILEGKKSELIIGFKPARFEEGERFAVAVSRAGRKGGAIVVNLDAKLFLEFRREVGFGKLIQDVGQQSGVDYIVLQSSDEIIAANKSVEGISFFKDDEFLRKVYEEEKVLTRTTEFQGHPVFEVVKVLSINGVKYGVFRIGLTMDEVKSVQMRMYRRAFVLTFVLFVITVILVSVVVTNQNYRILSEEYKKIKSLTNNILENFSLAVITIDKDNFVRIFNRFASQLFALESNLVVNKNIFELNLFSNPSLRELFEKKAIVSDLELEIMIGDEEKILKINSSVIIENEQVQFYTVTIEDVTELKQNELIKQQNEKLIAMGELASSVAHEIRNPLNSIMMISQRLEREIQPYFKNELFVSLSKVLKDESSRVNKIIEDFIKFARSPKLVPVVTKVSEFFESLKPIVDIMVKDKKIRFGFKIERDNIIKIDIEQMRQVFINLIQNAIDAIDSEGEISIAYTFKNNRNVFEVKDTGRGISPENMGKIFNIYFTTKKEGNGLGLSIVQRIILQHSGTIIARSEVGKGTTFKITLP
ncbi:MAG: sensor histidine kinase [Ignavibacteria bacterium]